MDCRVSRESAAAHLGLASTDMVTRIPALVFSQMRHDSKIMQRARLAMFLILSRKHGAVTLLKPFGSFERELEFHHRCHQRSAAQRHSCRAERFQCCDSVRNTNWRHLVHNAVSLVKRCYWRKMSGCCDSDKSSAPTLGLLLMADVKSSSSAGSMAEDGLRMGI
jgi:hypothetical protein